LTVIAEGVETEQQAKFLRAEGCHEFQGYLLGRAVSAQDYCGTFCPVGQGATGACPVAARIQLQG
jgi:EAL domain-containing protein (putative c-di-GMP-specific phosphodiesterase class I)